VTGCLYFEINCFASGSVSSAVDVVVEKTPLPCVKNGESSDSANSPDRDTFSPPPPVLSPCNDYINKSGILIPSVIGSTESGILVRLIGFSIKFNLLNLTFLNPK